LSRPFIWAGAAAVALALAGCGDNGEGGSGTVTAQPGPGTTETAPARAETETATETGPKDHPAETSPEEQPGGAGDEEPIRTEVVLTGRGGRIRPRLVRVPPFIGIRVELRSADGGAYTLRLGGRTIRAGAGGSPGFVDVGGLRSGERVVARPVGAGNRVVIEASAEPGP
jgi:hypothetical protein